MSFGASNILLLDVLKTQSRLTPEIDHLLAQRIGIMAEARTIFTTQRLPRDR